MVWRQRARLKIAFRRGGSSVALGAGVAVAGGTKRLEQRPGTGKLWQTARAALPHSHGAHYLSIQLMSLHCLGVRVVLWMGALDEQLFFSEMVAMAQWSLAAAA